MKYKDIDLGFSHFKETPLSGRKSISFLLGAGFSAPKGYPIGTEMNEGLFNFDDKNVFFSPSGKLSICTDGHETEYQKKWEMEYSSEIFYIL